MIKRILIPFVVFAVLILVAFLLFNDLEVYFTNLLEGIRSHVYLYAGISFLLLLADVVLPVPSSIVMYTNGYALGIFMGASLSLLSLLVSAVVGYYLGSLTALGRKSGDDQQTIKFWVKYGALAILMSRGIPILAESICLVCGYNRVPFKQFFFLSFVGYLPLCILYAICGSIGYNEHVFLISFACSLLIAFAFWFFGRKLFHNSWVYTK